MAGIINTVKIKFTEEGADQAAAATENVNKSQTRLGNTSASNGRQFAAQSQGLGGLVAAYAGAAATSFALQQAFTALQKAAQFDQIIQGTNTFSSQFGQSASSVLSDIKRITQGQLSIVEAATSANIALSAGFNTKQLNELADVATKSSRALGRDLQDSFQRLVRGSAKLEAELLDELGIFTRIEPAVEKYAAKVGKATTALSEFERRQAFVNSVIEEGQSKFSIIDTSTATASQSYSKLAATLTDLALTIGNVLANALVPFVNYINNNVSAAFGAFGLITALILAKTNQLASEGLTNLTNKITTFSGALSTSFVGSGKVAAEVLGNLAIETSNFNNRLGKGLGDQKARRDELINLAKAGTITVNQVRELNSVVKEQIARDTESKAKLELKKASLDATSETYKRVEKELTNTTISLNQNTAQLTANNKVLAQQSVLANAAAVATAGFGKAVGLLGSALGKALSFLNVLLTLYSIANLLGPALLGAFGGLALDKLLEKFGEIGKKLVGLDKDSKALDSGAKGFAANLTEAAIKAQDIKGNLEGTIKDKFLGISIDVKINSETIQKEVSDAILKGIESSEKAQAQLQKGIYTPRRLLSGFQRFEIQAPETSQEKLDIAGQTAFNNVLKDRIDSRKKLLEQAADVTTIKLLQAEIQALTESLGLDKEKLQIIGSISATTGISTKELFKFTSAAKDGTITMKTLDGTLQGQVYTIAQINKLSEDRQKGARELNTIQERIAGQNFNLVSNSEKLSKAQLDLNGIGKARSDLLSAEEAIETQIKTLLDSRVKVDDRRVIALRNQLDTLSKQREAFNAQAAPQEAILRVQESIRKTFSSQINALTNITGLTDSAGRLATDDLEVKRNQLSILQETAAASDAITQPLLAQGVAAADLESRMSATEKLIYRAGQTAKQALGGSIIEVVKKAVELTQEYEKQNIELKKQSQSIRLSIQREELTLQQQINDKQSEYNTLIIQNQINAIQRQQRVNELAAERIDILRKGREEEIKSQMSGVLGPLFSDQQKRLIEIRFKEEELNDLKKALGAQVASAAATLKKEEELAIEGQKRDIERFAIQQKLNENDIANRTLEIDSKIEETKRQQALFEKQSQAIQEQIKAFLEHPKELSRVLSQNIQDQLEIAKRVNPDRAATLEQLGTTIEERQKALDLRIVGQVEEIGAKLTAAAEGVKRAQSEYLDALLKQKDALNNTAEGQKELLRLEKQISDARTTEAVAAAQAKYNAVLAETGNRLLAAQQSLDILKREAERAGNSFITVAVKAAESFGSNLEKGINSLVDAIANGTLTLENFKQGFKQFIISILSDITKSILNELITKPIKELVFGFTRDLITGLSGSTISDTLAKNITPAISSSLTASLGENVAKSISGLKEIGVTPVYVTNVAEFCACSSGNAAASGGANAAANAATSAAQGSAGRLIYNSPIGPNMPAATSTVQTVADRAGPNFYDSPIGPQIPAGGLPVQVQNTDAITQGITGAVAPAVTQAVTPAIGNIGTFGGSTGYQPFSITSPSTWSGNALQPTTDKAFGAIGPMTGIGFNGTVRGGNGLGPGNATTFGGNAPQNLGVGGGSSQFTTQQFTNPAFSTDAGGKIGLRADAGGLNTDGLQASIDPLTDKMKNLTTGVDGNIAKIAESTIAKEGENAVVGAASLAKQVDTAATEASTVAETLDIATKETGTVTDIADNAATQTSATTLLSQFIPAVGAASASLASLGGGSAVASVAPALIPVGAVGGIVGGGGAFARFAAGGGVRMRDRVPSLLEPGEFVMKKSSVDSIGRNSLERMNATGKSSGVTNVKVQVDNSGQPKEAQQGETQIDGETAIVKLILKDLNSNGPIRRSIRGNT